MAPKLRSEDGRHIVIRPLAYVAESQIERYARARAVPDHPLQAVRLAGQCAAQRGQAHAGRMGAAISRAAPSRSSPRCATSRRRTWPIRGRFDFSGPRCRTLPKIIKPVAESYWVIPDRLLAGKIPGRQEHAGSRTPARRAARRGLRRVHRPDRGRASCRRTSPIYPAACSTCASRFPTTACRASRSTWPRSWRTLDAALDAGRRVYVHCRAGIGRTGTVVACHLIEQRAAARRGADPAQRAVAGQRSRRHLARRPRDRRAAPTTSCACRRRTPIRTQRARGHGRRAHVCASGSRARWSGSRWAMRWPRTPSSASPAPSPRSATCWAAGRSTCRAAPGPTTPPWRCCWPRACCEREGFDAHDQVQRYARWQREGYGSATGQCVGISASVARALATAQYKRQPFAGSHDPEQLDKDPLSRVAPVVMYFFADAAGRGGQRGRVGAHHRAGAHGARLRAPAAAMLHLALSGRDKAAVLQPAARDCGSPRAPGRRCWRSTTGLMRAAMPPEITGGGAHRAGAGGGALGLPPQRETFREGALACRESRPRLRRGRRGLWRTSPAPTTA